MIPHGSLSIERKLVPWSKAGSDGSDGYWAVAAVGVLAGIAVTYARTPIHLPGHKALWWMVPVLATRLATRTSGGAMAGALATALTTLCLGGRLAGGVALMPLLIAGGFVLDVAARISQQRHLSPLHRALLFALAGAIANSIFNHEREGFTHRRRLPCPVRPHCGIARSGGGIYVGPENS